MIKQKNVVRLCSYLILCINVPIYIYKGIIQKAVPAMNQFYYIATSFLVTGLERILLDSFFPSTLRMIVREESRLIPMGIAVFIFIFLCFLVLKASAVNRNIRRLSVLTAYTCLTVTVFLIASRFRNATPWYLIEKQFRYFYIQQYCVLLLFLISAYLFIKHRKQHVRILSVLIAFVLVSAAAVIENYRYHYLYSDNFVNIFHMPLSFKWETLYDSGVKVAACFDRAQDRVAAHETLVCEEPPMRLNFGRDRK